MRPILFAIILLLTCVSSAQSSKLDDFDFHAADVALLQVKPVQKELGVTEAQRAKMNVFADRHRAHLLDLDKEYKAKKSKQDPRQDPRLMGYFIELKKNVLAQLTSSQLHRLAQISLQHLGLAALSDDKVGAKVGLSKDQVLKMRDAFQDGQAKFAAAEKEAAEPVLAKYKGKNAKDRAAAEAMQKQFDADMAAAIKKASPKLDSIKAAAQQKMMAIMTPPQKAKWTALLGKPFRPS